MIYGIIALLIGCASLFQLIRLPIKKEDDPIANNIRSWSVAIGGIGGGLFIIIKELIKYFQ